MLDLLLIADKPVKHLKYDQMQVSFRIIRSQIIEPTLSIQRAI